MEVVQAATPSVRILAFRRDAPAPNEVLCVDIRIHHEDDDGVTLSGTGDPTTIAGTVDEARADGALCGSGVIGGADAIVFHGVCDPSVPNTATMWIEGLYRDGQLAPARDHINPCAYSGCPIRFFCPSFGEPEVTVDFNLDTSPAKHLGFVDVAFRGTPPEGASSVCLAMRLVDSGGNVVWTLGDEGGSQGGECAPYWDLGGSDSWFMWCDADAPELVLSAWVPRVLFPADVPESDRLWSNPCPSPTTGSGPADWNGGCEVRAACLENVDVPMSIDADLRVGTRP